jgi:methionine--tRNA ligase beta chain
MGDHVETIRSEAWKAKKVSIISSTETQRQLAGQYPCIGLTDFIVAPIKPTIGKEEFERIDIRVGTIELVEDIPGSEKLVRLTVDFGNHKRTILAGMKKERTDPKEVKGKQALFVVNLEARKMMGELSEGMLFDIGYADGITPVLAIPEKFVPNGARAG